MEDKAKQRARDLGYGTDPLNRAEYTANEVREAFVEGYHQAEKDLELTVEDIVHIIEMYNELEFSREFSTVTFNDTCKEILKRFKDYKERKEK